MTTVFMKSNSSNPGASNLQTPSEDETALFDMLAPRKKLARNTYRIATSHGFLNVVDQAFVSVTSFATMILVGRIGGDVELGHYAVGFIYLWLLLSVPNALVWIPFTVRIPRLKDPAKSRLERSVAWHMIAFLFVSLPVTATIAYRADPHNHAFVLCMNVFVIGMALREHSRRILMAEKKMIGLLFVDIPTCVVQLASIGLLSWLGMGQATWILLSNGLVALIPGCFLMILSQCYKHAWHSSKLDLIRNWEIGKWLAGSAVVNASSEALVRFAIVIAMDISALGRFTAAYSLPMMANPLIIALSNFLRVTSAHEAVEDIPAKLRPRFLRWQLVFVLIGVVVFGGIAIFGGLASSFVYGERFRGLGGAISSICSGLAISLISIPSEVYLASHGRTKTLLVASVARLVGVISIAAPLIYLFGLVGAGFTITLGYSIALMIQLLQTRKIFAKRNGGR